MGVVAGPEGNGLDGGARAEEAADGAQVGLVDGWCRLSTFGFRGAIGLSPRPCRFAAALNSVCPKGKGRRGQVAEIEEMGYTDGVI